MSWTLELEQPFASMVIRRYRWPSGLKLVIAPDHAADIFSYQTWLGVGSRNERKGHTGIAHLFEHLLFSCPTSIPAGEFDRRIEACGGDTNAATWADWTYYRTSLPARDLELAIRLEADRMSNLHLASELIEAEREVVLNERLEHVDNDVDGYLDEQLFHTAFTHHPYGTPTIGWLDDIRALTRDEIRSFYATHYVPNNATIVVVGAVEPDRLLDLVARHYGELEPATMPSAEIATEPEQRGPRRVALARPVTADRLVVGYKAPPQSHPDWIALEFLSSVLSSGPSARLNRALIVDRQLATSVTSHLMPFRDPSLLQLAVNLRRGCPAADAEAVIDEILADLASRPLDAAELAKVRNCVETEFWSELQSCDGKAEALGHFEATLGDLRQLFTIASALDRVGAEAVMRAARTYCDARHRTTVVAEPESAA